LPEEFWGGRVDSLISRLTLDRILHHNTEGVRHSTGAAAGIVVGMDAGAEATTPEPKEARLIVR